MVVGAAVDRQPLAAVGRMIMVDAAEAIGGEAGETCAADVGQ